MCASPLLLASPGGSTGSNGLCLPRSSPALALLRVRASSGGGGDTPLMLSSPVLVLRTSSSYPSSSASPSSSSPFPPSASSLLLVRSPSTRVPMRREYHRRVTPLQLMLAASVPADAPLVPSAVMRVAAETVAASNEMPPFHEATAMGGTQLHDEEPCALPADLYARVVRTLCASPPPPPPPSPPQNPRHSVQLQESQRLITIGKNGGIIAKDTVSQRMRAQNAALRVVPAQRRREYRKDAERRRRELLARETDVMRRIVFGEDCDEGKRRRCVQEEINLSAFSLLALEYIHTMQRMEADRVLELRRLEEEVHRMRDAMDIDADTDADVDLQQFLHHTRDSNEWDWGRVHGFRFDSFADPVNPHLFPHEYVVEPTASSPSTLRRRISTSHDCAKRHPHSHSGDSAAEGLTARFARLFSNPIKVPSVTSRARTVEQQIQQGPLRAVASVPNLSNRCSHGHSPSLESSPSFSRLTPSQILGIYMSHHDDAWQSAAALSCDKLQDSCSVHAIQS
ncbi:hypothetical protein HDU84_004205 [Entophlyctis sp. JEL0112]|nr:hypothetical protein HDU84_004205 [Entophlyctis sp. JEL0112]